MTSGRTNLKPLHDGEGTRGAAYSRAMSSAVAFGPPPQPTDRLCHVARLAWRTLPYAFARSGRSLSGPVAFHLRAPSGETWEFEPDEPATTIVRGDAADLCLVAARRIDRANTSLGGDGPDLESVLDLVRTYA